MSRNHSRIPQPEAIFRMERAYDRSAADKVIDIDRSAIRNQKRATTRPPLKGSGGGYGAVADFDEMPEGAQYFGPLAHERAGIVLGKAMKADEMRGRQSDPGAASSGVSGGYGGKGSIIGGGKMIYDVLARAVETKKKKGGMGISQDGDRDPAVWDKIAESMKGAGIGRKVGGNVVDSLGYEMEPVRLVVTGGASPEELYALAKENPAAVKAAMGPIVDRLPEESKTTWHDTLRTISSVISDVTPLLQLIADLKRGKGQSGGAMVPDQLLHGNFMGGRKKISDIIGAGEIGGAKPKRAPSEWQKFVSKISREKGLNLRESMAYIKRHNLWKKSK